MVAGAVLAGGRSRRYGRNKALELFQGERLVDRSVKALRSFCDPIFLVANDLSLFLDVHANLIQDLVAHEGPLYALYTALLYSPHEWVFVKAADMPFLVPELVPLTMELREKADAVVPLFNERYEPLLALYSQQCLPAMAAALERGERKITNFYGNVRLRCLKEKVWRTVDPEGMSFFNVNTPEDLEHAVWS